MSPSMAPLLGLELASQVAAAAAAAAADGASQGDMAAGGAASWPHYSSPSGLQQQREAADVAGPSSLPATATASFSVAQTQLLPELAGEICREVLQAVDTQMSEKLKELQGRGKQAMQQARQERERQSAQLLESVEQCRTALDGLEAEQQQLRLALAELAERLSLAESLSENCVPGILPMTAPTKSQLLASDRVVGRPRPPPLSLADALGFGFSEEAQSSMSRFSSGAVTPLATPSSVPSVEEVDAFIFRLTLRLVPNSILGLLTSVEPNGCLRVEGVLPGSAAEAWNRQCSSSGAAERVLCFGDQIVSVNDVSGDVDAMSLEMQSRQLLKLQVFRNCRTSMAIPLVASTTPLPRSCASMQQWTSTPLATTPTAAHFMPQGPAMMPATSLRSPGGREGVVTLRLEMCQLIGPGVSCGSPAGASAGAAMAATLGRHRAPATAAAAGA